MLKLDSINQLLIRFLLHNNTYIKTWLWYSTSSLVKIYNKACFGFTELKLLTLARKEQEKKSKEIIQCTKAKITYFSFLWEKKKKDLFKESLKIKATKIVHTIQKDSKETAISKERMRKKNEKKKWEKITKEICSLLLY